MMFPTGLSWAQGTATLDLQAHPSTASYHLMRISFQRPHVFLLVLAVAVLTFGAQVRCAWPGLAKTGHPYRTGIGHHCNGAKWTPPLLAMHVLASRLGLILMFWFLYLSHCR